MPRIVSSGVEETRVTYGIDVRTTQGQWVNVAEGDNEESIRKDLAFHMTEPRSFGAAVLRLTRVTKTVEVIE